MSGGLVLGKTEQPVSKLLTKDGSSAGSRVRVGERVVCLVLVIVLDDRSDMLLTYRLAPPR